MIKYTNKESFVMLQHRMFAVGTKFWCTNDEKLVYAELWLLQNIGLMESIREENDRVILTHIDILTSQLGWIVPSKESKGRTRTAEALNGLMSKGYIVIDLNDEITNKTRDTLYITLPYFDVEGEEGLKIDVPFANTQRNYYGFIKIESSIYNFLKTDYDLTLYAYANWREQATFEYRISFLEWSYVLGVSERQARTIIDKSDVVFKQRGYYNPVTKKQETNGYSTNKDKTTKIVEEKETVSNWEKKVKDQVVANENNEVITSGLEFRSAEPYDEEESILERMFKGDKIIESMMKNVLDKDVKNDTTLFREIQDTSVLMTQRAYNIIRTTEDGALRQMGINKIELMNKSKGGRIALEKFDRAYNKSQIRF